MNTNNDVKFNYLKPHISMINYEYPLMIDMPAEYQFYFKHKIIHWLNIMNEDSSPTNNFDNISIMQYSVVNINRITATFTINDFIGYLHFNYTSEGEFHGNTIEGECGIYQNTIKFPNTAHLLKINFSIDSVDNIIFNQYMLERTVDNGGHFIDNFNIQYCFNIDGVQVSDTLYFYVDSIGEELFIEKKIKDNESDYFNDFFNTHIDDILKSTTTFFELYPQFGIKRISSDLTLSIFYNGLKKLYRDGIFDNGLEQNLKLVAMAGI